MTEVEKTKILLNELKEIIHNLHYFWQKLDSYMRRIPSSAMIGENVEYLTPLKIAELLNAESSNYIEGVLRKHLCKSRLINQEPHYNLQDILICLRNYLRSFTGE